jgi:hypothetical protein
LRASRHFAAPQPRPAIGTKPSHAGLLGLIMGSKNVDKEIETLVLEIVSRMQGCAGLKSVTIVPNENVGWIVSAWDRGTASPADSTRAIALAQIDLRKSMIWSGFNS